MFTSRSNCTFRAFRLKWLAKVLPIGVRFASWGAEHNLEGICRRCHQETETADHLLECVCAQPALSAFATVFVEEFVPLWDKEEPKKGAFVANFLLEMGLSPKNFDGVLDESLGELLLNLPPNVPKKAAAICMMKALWRFFYFEIWLPRCEDTIKSEKLLGISQHQKRRPHKGGRLQPSKPSLALKFGRSQAQDQAIWRLTIA